MSSATRSAANTEQGNRFFINVAAVTSAAGSGNVYDATGAQVALVGTAQLNATAGGVLVRDMGKTVRIASQGATAHAASVSIATVLRKVQLVRASVDSDMPGANVPLSSFIGLNEGVSGNAANSFETFYIQLSPSSVWAVSGC
jgi:hypothetical protein